MKQDHYEIAVVGGGISGTGVALAAAQAGIKVVLFEKKRCCEATSQSSLRIMHGGFRYFQTLDLKRVLVSLSDQHHLFQKYPQLVVPLPCLMPLARWGLKSRWPARAGSLAYSVFKRAATGSPAEARVLERDEAERAVPLLRGLVPHGALFWNDAVLLDPAALKDALLIEVRALGGEILQGAGVEEIRQNGENWILRAGGQEVVSRIVVNCTGPWIETLKRPDSCRLFLPRWCKAFNLVLNKQIESRYAVGLQSDEGRLYFVAPRGEASAIGTWYGEYHGLPEDESVSDQEMVQFADGFNRAWPGIDLDNAEIARVEAGVLPMRRMGRDGPVLYGSHRIKTRESYIEVLSTKYTTFRSQAAEVMKLAAPYLKTR